ncbi:Cellulose binding domain-containing protein [Micromonospora haikouensis]|uniref:Pectate lyase n=1 Tax=Micromonospora haikouensis TaxID=686309 RepID=A0A1C4WVK3_9ACTN|nr:pectate lyase [Micromonospora haikouensis]SCF00174.1 Cellulose binding domain-containing protein [Micromonospora haikouensis]
MLHRQRRKSLLVVTAAAATLAAAGVVATAGAAQAAAGCRVSYAVGSQWPGGFSTTVTLTNVGDPLTSWRLTWSFGAGQTVTQAWNATVTQSGSAVTATNVSFNGNLATNASTAFGFNGTWNNSSNPTPTSFAVNGVTCTGGTSPTTPGNPTTPPPTAPPPTTPPPTGSWPTPTGQVGVDGTIPVSGVFDGGMRRYCCIGDGSQEESQDPMFQLAAGATLQNVIIGGPAGDGVHCAGSCTLRNVWWEDVGEDAATFRGSGSPVFLVDGGGARSASDKVFQHNGAGTLTVQNFQATNFGTFYRSCGNCSTQYKRAVVIRNSTLTRPGNTVAGINVNYGDTARFSGITIVNDSSRSMVICRKYNGNNTGSEPTQVGTGADGTNCLYSSSDLTYR